jgi:hypothetical protein
MARHKTHRRAVTDKQLLASAWSELRSGPAVHPSRQVVLGPYSAVQRPIPWPLREVRTLDQSGRRDPVPPRLRWPRPLRLPRTRSHRHDDREGHRRRRHPRAIAVPRLSPGARWGLLVMTRSDVAPRRPQPVALARNAVLPRRCYVQSEVLGSMSWITFCAYWAGGAAACVGVPRVQSLHISGRNTKRRLRGASSRDVAVWSKRLDRPSSQFRPARGENPGPNLAEAAMGDA